MERTTAWQDTREDRKLVCCKDNHQDLEKEKMGTAPHVSLPATAVSIHIGSTIQHLTCCPCPPDAGTTQGRDVIRTQLGSFESAYDVLHSVQNVRRVLHSMRRAMSDAGRAPPCSVDPAAPAACLTPSLQTHAPSSSTQQHRQSTTTTPEPQGLSQEGLPDLLRITFSESSGRLVAKS